MTVEKLMEKLMEKVIRARIHLESYRDVPHTNLCPALDDTSYAPCNCGASAKNAPVERAMEALRL